MIVDVVMKVKLCFRIDIVLKLFTDVENKEKRLTCRPNFRIRSFEIAERSGPHQMLKRYRFFPIEINAKWVLKRRLGFSHPSILNKIGWGGLIILSLTSVCVCVFVTVPSNADT